jgi:hypothetical protein
MTNLSDLQLEQASHSELVMMVRLLLTREEALEKENQLLREEIERSKPKTKFTKFLSAAFTGSKTQFLKQSVEAECVNNIETRSLKI